MWTRLALAAALGALGGCGAGRGDADVTLVVGAYSAPRELFRTTLLPGFAAAWRAEHGQTVAFEESYQGSGAQSRAVVSGFEADVVALAMAPDLERIAAAGLIAGDWQTGRHRGVAMTTIVVMAVRAGNPLGVRDWADLARPGVAVVLPNPKVSGAARWTVMALWGAAVRGQVAGVPAGDPARAHAFLVAVLGNVVTMDRTARDAMLTFELGLGDVALNYENEVVAGRAAGQDYAYVVPAATIRVDNPVAVIDVHVDRHGTRAAAEAFADYLASDEVQGLLPAHGLRPAGSGAAAAAPLPPVGELFTVDDLGGWAAVTRELFGPGGHYDRAFAEARR